MFVKQTDTWAPPSTFTLVSRANDVSMRAVFTCDARCSATQNPEVCGLVISLPCLVCVCAVMERDVGADRQTQSDGFSSLLQIHSRESVSDFIPKSCREKADS